MIRLQTVQHFKQNFSDQLPEIKGINDQSILLILLTLLLKESEHLTFFEKNFIQRNENLFGSSSEQTIKLLDKNHDVVKHFNFDQTLAELAELVTQEYKVQVLLVLFDFSISSGRLSDKNVIIIKQISDELGIDQQLFLKVLNKYKFYNQNYRQKAFSDLSAQASTNSLVSALKIMGLPFTKDVDLIKKTYRQLAIKYHPDKQQFKTQEEINQSLENFKAINEAYDIIKDLLKFN